MNILVQEAQRAIQRIHSRPRESLETIQSELEEVRDYVDDCLGAIRSDIALADTEMGED